MKVVLYAHGTRGDVAPMVALGWQLAHNGHEVTAAVPCEFQGFADRAGLDFAPLPFDMMAWLRAGEGRRLLHAGGIPLLRGLAREYELRADSFDDAYLAAAQGAEAFVANHVTCDRAFALGDAMRVPAAVFIPYPATHSRKYSSLALTRGKLRSSTLRIASHELHHRIWWHQIAKPVNRFRGKLGLPPSPRPTYRRLMDPDSLSLYSLSTSLFPRPDDWPEQYRVTAPWKVPGQLRDDLDEALPDDLEDWIEEGDPPIFLGFGSMPVLEPQTLLDTSSP